MGKVEDQRAELKKRREKKYAAKHNLVTSTRDRRRAKKRLEEARKAAKKAVGTDAFERAQARRRKAAEALREANLAVDSATDRYRAARARVRRAVKRLRHLEAASKPATTGRVITRAEWGAAPPRGSYLGQSALIAGVQHHTANPALPATATVAQEAARMRQMQAGHFAQGWTDLGYAYVVFPSGRIYEGRPKQYVGAHTLGHNSGYAGWSYDANCEVSQPTPAGLASCRRVRRELFGVGGKRLYGHRDLGPTACPGRNLYSKLGQL